MAATVTDFRSLQAPQGSTEPFGTVARAMLIIIGAPGSVEEQLVRRVAGAGVPFGGGTRSEWCQKAPDSPPGVLTRASIALR
jgi:hypothetical protein